MLEKKPSALAGGVCHGNGNSTYYSYDPANRLASVSNALNQITHYYYDNVGRLQSILDANGHSTGFTYDGLGRQTDKQWPGGSFEHYGYDLAGNQISQNLADGTTNTFGFDSLNRPITATYQDGRKVAYTYTPTGQRNTVSDSKYGNNVATNYLYDNRDRVTQITQPSGQKVGYGYDALSNRTSLIVTATGSTTTTSYGYDAASELKVVTDSIGSVTKFDYYQSGPRLDEILPIGITTTYGYDTLNRLTNITQTNSTGPVTPLATFAYKLDNAGNRTNITEVLKYTTAAATTRNLQYGYDPTYRLKTEWDSTSPTTTYGYDNVGNRLSMQVGTATPTSYGYNELDQLRTMTTTGGTVNQYSYVRGNLIKVNTVGSSSSITYTWDSGDRLTGVITGTQSSAYTYDADGHRVAQTQGGTTTNYLWDAASNYGDVLLETTGTVSPTFQASYVMAGGEIVSQNKGGVTSYLLKDGQGSTRALFSGGSLVTAGGSQIYSYTAFGSLQTAATTVGTSYLYTGQQYDQPTGLYDLRARYYNPVDGRFLSQDTFGYNTPNPRELDRYGYAASNPITLDDPTGRMAAEYTLGNLTSRSSTAVPALTGAGVGAGVSDILLAALVLISTGTLIEIRSLINFKFKFDNFTIAIAVGKVLGSVKMWAAMNDWYTIGYKDKIEGAALLFIQNIRPDFFSGGVQGTSASTSHAEQNLISYIRATPDKDDPQDMYGVVDKYICQGCAQGIINRSYPGFGTVVDYSISGKIVLHMFAMRGAPTS